LIEQNRAVNQRLPGRGQVQLGGESLASPIGLVNSLGANRKKGSLSQKNRKRKVVLGALHEKSAAP